MTIGGIPGHTQLQIPIKILRKNSPHQEGIISEMNVSPNQSYIEEPQELVDLVDTSKLVQKYLPKQTDIK